MLSHFFAQFAALLGGLPLPDLTDRNTAGLIVLIVFMALFAIELAFGHRPFPKRVMGHSYLTNLGIFLLNDVSMSLLSVGSLCLLAIRMSDFGAFSHIDNVWLRSGLSFLALDLTLYVWHLACHQFAGLWRFHRVHHSDLAMNVSTAFRLHGMEMLLTTVVKCIVIVALGIETTVLLVNELLTTLFVMFHHANIRVPGESSMGKVFVVPRLHRMHHSQLRTEHDSNYGALFSLWDRLFGTLREGEPAAIGLPNIGEHTVWETVKHGFSSLQPAPAAVPVRTMIAEAAYYRAQRRGFQPGQELTDWIQAEREVMAKVERRRHTVE